jgi:hypothetical protein
MPINIVPTSYLAGCRSVTSDGAGALASAALANSTEYLCIPLATLTGAVSDDIHPTTGDIRKIMFALETAVYDAAQVLAAADRPTKWTLARSQSFNSSGATITRNFIHQFNTEVAGEEVADEPS